VWVFVDYNEAGKMTRLPLLPGATLTDTSAPGVGEVVEVENNNRGVWVVGNARIADAGSFSATVKLLTTTANVTGACAYASNYPPVGEYTGTNTIKFTGTAPYTVMLEGVPEPQMAGSHYMVGSTIASFTDKTGAPGLIIGIHQPQGSCTYTAPAVVGTFAAFPNNYDGGTYVSLRDERDNKIYPVVKINNRWIMALNLNYQKDLYFNANSNQAHGSTFNSAGSGTFAIGSFWCPGGDGGGTVSTSIRTSCDVWGALYTWETAMMVDGKWSNDSRNATSWSEPSYSVSTDVGNTNNGGRGANGRGICPPNWHVPTDGEWGDILNAMETNADHNSGTSRRGSVAGASSKSKCMCSSGRCNDDENVSWPNGSVGTDFYGFRVLPSGNRLSDGSGLYYRGMHTYFWSSSAASGTRAWARIFSYNRTSVYRGHGDRSNGYSVRCRKD
jgi:uncharacterized protein (TIGR02145 family)